MSQLKWFHEYFWTIVDKKNYAAKSLSQKLDVNYLKVLQFLKGDWEFTKDEMDRIISNDLFDQSEKILLKEKYKYTSVSKSQRENLLLVEKSFDLLHNTLIQKNTLSMLMNKNHIKEDVSKIENTCQLISQEIFKSYNACLKSALVLNKPIGLEIEFYLPPVDALIDEIYQTLKAIHACLNKNISINCIFLIDYIERLDHMAEFSRYIQLMTLDNMVSIRLIKRETHNNSNIKNYYIVFEDKAIQLDDEAQNALLLVDHSNHKLKDDLAVHMNFCQYVHTNELRQYLFDVVEGSNYLGNHSRSLRYSFSSLSFDVESYLYKMDEMKKSDAAGSESEPVVNGFHHRILKEKLKIESKTGRINQFICSRGIVRFLEDGILNDYVEIIGAFTIDERLGVVIETLKQINRGYEMRLISQMQLEQYFFLDLLKFFEIRIEGEIMIIIRHLDKAQFKINTSNCINLDGHSVQYGILVTDSAIVSAFKLFFDHILMSISLSAHETFDFIKQVTLDCFSGNHDQVALKLLKDIQEMSYEPPIASIEVR